MTKRYTDRQLTALTDPCFEAEECAQPQYHRLVTKNRRLVSTILTANVGTE